MFLQTSMLPSPTCCSSSSLGAVIQPYSHKATRLYVPYVPYGHTAAADAHTTAPLGYRLQAAVHSATAVQPRTKALGLQAIRPHDRTATRPHCHRSIRSNSHRPTWPRHTTHDRPVAYSWPQCPASKTAWVVPQAAFPIAALRCRCHRH